MNNAGIEGCRVLVHEYPTDAFDRVSPTRSRALLVIVGTY